MYKCNYCERLLEDYEVEWVEDEIYNDIGSYVCPHCKECVTDEITQCKECEEWFNDDELKEGLCESCIKEKVKDKFSGNLNNCFDCLNDPETRIEYGEVFLNPALTTIFTVDEIEVILYQHLLDSPYLSDYIGEIMYEYNDWFVADILTEEVKK